MNAANERPKNTNKNKEIEINPTQNILLSLLPQIARDRIFPHLQLVPLTLGQVLYEPGFKMTSVYFPTDSIVSLLYVMENGASAEISVVGNEGLVGISLFMGGQSTPSRAVVQSAGYAYKLNSSLMMTEFNRHGDLMTLLLIYTQSLITQMAQTAVCNRHHSVDQQLCRWLLLSPCLMVWLCCHLSAICAHKETGLTMPSSKAQSAGSGRC